MFKRIRQEPRVWSTRGTRDLDRGGRGGQGGVIVTTPLSEGAFVLCYVTLGRSSVRGRLGRRGAVR